MNRKRQPPPRARDLNPEIPEALSTFTARLMAVDPADRFQSYAEIQSATGRLVSEMQHGPSGSSRLLSWLRGK